MVSLHISFAVSKQDWNHPLPCFYPHFSHLIFQENLADPTFKIYTEFTPSNPLWKCHLVLVLAITPLLNESSSRPSLLNHCSPFSALQNPTQTCLSSSQVPEGSVYFISRFSFSPTLHPVIFYIFLETAAYSLSSLWAWSVILMAFPSKMQSNYRSFINQIAKTYKVRKEEVIIYASFKGWGKCLWVVP